MDKLKTVYLHLYYVYAYIAEKLAFLSMIVCCVLLIAATSVTLLSVLFRYILSRPLPWPEELARYILVWLALIGASIVTKEREHISLTSFSERLSPKLSLFVELIISIIIVIVLSALWRHSWIMVTTRSLRIFSPSLPITMAWAHGALPVGLGMIMFQTIFVVLDCIKGLITGMISSKDTCDVNTNTDGGIPC